MNKCASIIKYYPKLPNFFYISSNPNRWKKIPIYPKRKKERKKRSRSSSKSQSSFGAKWKKKVNNRIIRKEKDRNLCRNCLGRAFPGRVSFRAERIGRPWREAFRGFEMQSSRSPDSEREARPGWKRHLVRSKVVSSVNLRFSSPPPLERNFLLPPISYFASSPFPCPRLLNFPSDVISRANAVDLKWRSRFRLKDRYDLFDLRTSIAWFSPNLSRIYPVFCYHLTITNTSEFSLFNSILLNTRVEFFSRNFIVCLYSLRELNG